MSSTSIHTRGKDVVITTEWLNQDSTHKTRLLIVKTEDHDITFFMDEDCKVLLDIGRED